jgi:hypothetical protein
MGRICRKRQNIVLLNMRRQNPDAGRATRVASGLLNLNNQDVNTNVTVCRLVKRTGAKL